MRRRPEKKKLRIDKEKLRNLTPRELSAVGGGDCEGDRESATNCDTPGGTDTCLI